MLGALPLALALSAGEARADLTASYDGLLSGRKLAAPAGAAAVLSQSGGAVSATIALGGVGTELDGAYAVQGVLRLRGTRLTLAGFGASGARLTWKARVDGTVIEGNAKVRGQGAKLTGRLSLVRRDAQPPAQPREVCDSPFFTTEVMPRVLVPVCANCHTAAGSARDTAFRVTAADALATQASMLGQLDTGDPTRSRLVQKPLAALPHGGGQQVQPGSEAAELLLQWAQLVAADQHCGATAPQAPQVALAPVELLARASMDLRGIRPAPAHLDAIEADPDAYATLVDEYLHSDAFLERVKDVYDDALLVRREDFTDEARDETAALYAEALELIAYVVQNDRPFTEIGTADYTVANPLFQDTRGRLPYPMEPVSGPGWQPTHYTDGRPHAGLLSTSAFYGVWDTNNTNLNRRRANRWSIVFHCYNFLDTPVDVTRDVDNNDASAVLDAVTARADCAACHQRLDPMASFLFPMDEARFEENDADDFYRGNPERWRRVNRRPPAIDSQPGMDIRDMGRLLVEHPRFAQCQTRRAFRLLAGRDPQTGLELAAADDIAARWAVEDGYDYRALVKRWLTSEVYRSRPVADHAAWVRRVSPERLEALVADLTGFVWTRAPDDDEDDDDPASLPNRTAPVPLLTTEERGFKIILGGINGTSVSARAASLNAPVAIVHRKLAALAAEHVVRTDLALPDGERRLLAGVTGTEAPATDAAVIRTVIARLGRRLYGVRWAADGPEVDVWFDLFAALHGDASQAGTGRNQVAGTAAERAWRGVLVAMLRSPRILLY